MRMMRRSYKVQAGGMIIIRIRARRNLLTLRKREDLGKICKHIKEIITLCQAIDKIRLFISF
jgi:hypothetical protein